MPVAPLAEPPRVTKESVSHQYAFINHLYAELKDLILVRDQLVNILAAGRDTTACLISWTFRLLVRYPAVLVKLRKEIEDVLGDEQSVTRTHVRNMHYLDCVLKEMLRLYPPVPANLRFATKTTVFPRGGGPDTRSPILVRQGTGITYSPYLMHRRTALYGADANFFRPERWEDSKLTGIRWGFLPFNDGPRVCLGSKCSGTCAPTFESKLMLTFFTRGSRDDRASYGIVRIIQAFPTIRLPPDDVWKEPGTEKHAFTLVLASEDGYKVLLA